MKHKPLKRFRPKTLPQEGRENWDYLVTPNTCVMCLAGYGLRELSPNLFPWTARPHHIIAKQRLLREGFENHIWDSRNKLDLCGDHHAQHESGSLRVPKSLLPSDAWAFARDLGLDWYIERYYK